jgi:hypothetical protein
MDSLNAGRRSFMYICNHVKKYVFIIHAIYPFSLFCFKCIKYS